jgi:hypothetical protein
MVLAAGPAVPTATRVAAGPSTAPALPAGILAVVGRKVAGPVTAPLRAVAPPVTGRIAVGPVAARPRAAGLPVTGRLRAVRHLAVVCLLVAAPLAAERLVVVTLAVAVAL